MPPRKRRAPRLLVAVAALCLGSVAWSPMASAHVHAGSDNPVRGAMAVVTFQVPNESNTGAATTALTVALPNVAAAHTETMPGWTARLDRDAASGTVRSVTWTAAAGGGIGPDQFALFRLSVKLPDADTVSFPATQTYADGTVVKWDQPPLPDGGEPEHPAPTLALAAGPAAGHQHPGGPPAAANAARWLGGAPPGLAALGIAIALVRRRALGAWALAPALAPLSWSPGLTRPPRGAPHRPPPPTAPAGAATTGQPGTAPPPPPACPAAAGPGVPVPGTVSRNDQDPDTTWPSAEVTR